MRGRTVFCTLLFLFFVVVLSAQTTQEGFAHVSGADLYYKKIGSGEPVVILHGGPGLEHTYFLPQFQQLAKHYTLIFYDQRASGKSSGVVDTTTMLAEQFVEDLEGLRKVLKLEKMNLFGHSWGGLLAMEYAFTYPRHVKSLILSNSVGANSEWLLPYIQTRTARTTHEDSLAFARITTSKEFAQKEPKAVEEFARTIFRTYFYNRAFADSLRLTFTQQTASNVLDIFGLFLKQYQQYDIRTALSSLSFPTLIISCDYDVMLPRFEEEIHRAIKQSKYVLLKNSGHFPFIESPEQFFGECDHFLKSNQ
ncbi:MAG: alpha/beta fold hydrolase [Bacteroidota bacterium]